MREASIATCWIPAAARLAMDAARLTGSGVVSPAPCGMPGATSPRVPSEAALWAPRAQSCRRKSAVLVLPLVPVTAAMRRGCGPAMRAAICARRRRGSASRIRGRGGTPAGQSGALRRQNGRGSARHGIGDIVPSVMRAPRKGCEELARLHLAAVRGDAADIDISGPRWAGPAVAGSCLHQINEPHRREPGRDTSRRAASWRPPRRARSSRPSPL